MHEKKLMAQARINKAFKNKGDSLVEAELQTEMLVKATKAVDAEYKDEVITNEAINLEGELAVPEEEVLKMPAMDIEADKSKPKEEVTEKPNLDKLIAKFLRFKNERAQGSAEAYANSSEAANTESASQADRLRAMAYTARVKNRK